MRPPRTVLGLVILAAALIGATGAAAHGGALLLDREAGPYRVVLQAGPARLDPRAVDLTTSLHRGGIPEASAVLRLQVRTVPGGPWSRPYAARRVGNTYEVVLAQPERTAWRGWAVRLWIGGPGGARTVTSLPPRDAGGPPAVAAIGSLAALLLGSIALVVAVRRRRGRTAARDAA